MNKYIFTLKHDNGVFKITVTATDITSAIQIFLKAEGCPEQAINNIKKLKK